MRTSVGRLIQFFVTLGSLCFWACSQPRTLNAVIDSDDSAQAIAQLLQAKPLLATGVVTRLLVSDAGLARVKSGRDVPISQAVVEISISDPLDVVDFRDGTTISVKCLVVPEVLTTGEPMLQTLPREGVSYLFILKTAGDSLSCIQDGYQSIFEIVPPISVPPAHVISSRLEKISYLLLGDPKLLQAHTDRWILQRLGFVHLALPEQEALKLLEWYAANAEGREKLVVCWSMPSGTQMAKECYKEACNSADLTLQDKFLCSIP